MLRTATVLTLLALTTPTWAHHTDPIAPAESVTDCYVSCDMVVGYVAHSASYASAPNPGGRESGLCVTRCNHVGAPFFFKSGFNACDSPCVMADGFSPYSSAEEWSVRLPSGRLQYWCDSDCHYPEEDDGTPATTAGAQWSEVASDAWVQWAPGRRSYRFLYRERGERPKNAP